MANTSHIEEHIHVGSDGVAKVIHIIDVVPTVVPDSEASGRRFPTPEVFREIYGYDAVFPHPKDRTYRERAEEILDIGNPELEKGKLESILGDIREVRGLHLIFDRIITEIRAIMKKNADTYEGIAQGLCHRDPKTQETLVSALYRFWYPEFAERVREFAASMGVTYDKNELSARKIEGCCRHFKDAEGRFFSLENIHRLCDRVASGESPNVADKSGKSLFVQIAAHLANRHNFEFAAKAIDVILNEFDEPIVTDPPLYGGKTVMDRILGANGSFMTRKEDAIAFLERVQSMSKVEQDRYARSQGDGHVRDTYRPGEASSSKFFAQV